MREEAVEAMLKRHGPAVRRWISIPPDLRSLLSVEDILQEAFVDAYVARKSSPTDDTEFRSWLGTLAANCLRDSVRSARALKRGGGKRPLGGSGVLREVAGGSAPSRGLRQADRARLLRDSAQALPEPYRTAALAMLEDCDASEVAARLNKGLGTTYVILGRTRRFLGEALRRHRSQLMERSS